MAYPSDVKLIVEVEFLDGEKREYGISADGPSVISHFARESAKTGFIMLWNKRDNHMIPASAIRSLSARRYEPEPEPKARKERSRKKDTRQTEMPL